MKSNPNVHTMMLVIEAMCHGWHFIRYFPMKTPQPHKLFFYLMVCEIFFCMHILRMYTFYPHLLYTMGNNMKARELISYERYSNNTTHHQTVKQRDCWWWSVGMSFCLLKKDQVRHLIWQQVEGRQMRKLWGHEQRLSDFQEWSQWFRQGLISSFLYI